LFIYDQNIFLFWTDSNLTNFTKMEEKNVHIAFFCEHQYFAIYLYQVGQGTYSSVFKARDLESGKNVALKKVRFDNFEPESIRFMSREIRILRMLDHPNVMKLEGLIASKLSCSLYLVFEYMEHDLAGLSSAPDIKFTESQVHIYIFFPLLFLLFICSWLHANGGSIGCCFVSQ
jgi:serine/threonine protein kinase